MRGFSDFKRNVLKISYGFRSGTQAPMQIGVPLRKLKFDEDIVIRSAYLKGGQARGERYFRLRYFLTSS